MAHNEHEANDDRENRLEKLVADVYQETGPDDGAYHGRHDQLQENLLVQVAVAREVDGAAEVADDEPDAVRAVCDRGVHSQKDHDGKAQRGAAPRDAVDEAYDCAQHEVGGIEGERCGVEIHRALI